MMDVGRVVTSLMLNVLSTSSVSMASGPPTLVLMVFTGTTPIVSVISQTRLVVLQEVMVVMIMLLTVFQMPQKLLQ